MGVSVQLRHCFQRLSHPGMASEALGGAVRLRVQLDFVQEDDGTFTRTGYEVHDARGELVALGGWGVGGPIHRTVEDACREAYDRAIESAVRNGVQELLPLPF